MARPKLKRTMLNPPVMEGFRPFGIAVTDLEPVVLLYEEYEAIRLTDYRGLTQQKSAEQMNISRPTFTRIYEKARRSIAKAFVEGKAIFIEGGDYHSDDFWYRCDSCLKLNISQEESNKCRYCGSGSLHRLNEKVSE
ncbi:MAG TPA: DUF134 domain-containing protein [Prolixibacteraceae bacterium]|nr:DUF134 domain-containing protein [Prolixibacteraceae bacterium]